MSEELEKFRVNEWVEVRSSEVHGRGVFAHADIPEGTYFVEYVGEKIDKEESTRRGLELMAESEKTGGAAVYIFTLDDEFDLDGDQPDNYAKLVNHTCDPNCEAQQEGHRIWLMALRDIQAGEELGFNYGFDLETLLDHPCRCGTERCVGYILGEDYWPELDDELLRLAEEEE